jgi:hypothetical protein
MSNKPLKLWSTQVAIVFLYLSEMRVTAFLTLPVSCVEINARRVEQVPFCGVLTKKQSSNYKILNIPHSSKWSKSGKTMKESMHLEGCGIHHCALRNGVARLQLDTRKILKGYACNFLSKWEWFARWPGYNTNSPTSCDTEKVPVE